MHGHGAQHTQTDADDRAPQVTLTHVRAGPTRSRGQIVSGRFFGEQEEGIQALVFPGIFSPVQVRTSFASGTQFLNSPLGMLAQL